MANELTVKQEKFCMFYIEELCNASKAYRKAYNAKNMKPETINKRASELLKNGKVTGRIEELQKNIQERHNITVDSLLIELEEARKISKAARSSSGMTLATMGKARLLGYLNPKRPQGTNNNKNLLAELEKRIVVNIIKPPPLTH